jgi:putative hemolysin
VADLASILFPAAGMGVSLAFSAFFSGSETALFSLPPDAVARFRRSPHSTARIAVALLARPRRLLTTVLLGNMLVNVAFFSIGSSFALEIGRTRGAGPGAAFAVATLLAVVLFGEILPKNIAVLIPERASRLVAFPLYGIQFLLLPLSRVLVALTDALHWAVDRLSPAPPFVTPDEMRTLLEISRSSGALDTDVSEMIAEVLDLSDARVRESMLPRVDLHFAEVHRDPRRLLHRMQSEKLESVAVYQKRRDNVLGLLYLKDLFFHPDRPVADLVRRIPFVPDLARLENALRELRAAHADSAFVVDEYGALVGWISLEEIVEEIVGEITDEYDRPAPLVEQVSPDEYRLAGSLSIRDWKELFRLSLPDVPADTVGGFVTALLGHIPRPGDTVRLRNLQLRVETVGRFRVHALRLTLHAPQPETAP